MNANHELVDPEEQRDDGAGAGDEDDVLDSEEPHENVDEDEDEDEEGEEDEEEQEQEEDNIDDDDDDDEDDEEDDDDNNNDIDEEDPMLLVNHIVIAMEDFAHGDGSLLFQPFGDWNVIGWIARLTDQGMALLVDQLRVMSASEQSWDHLVERITVDVEHPTHDMKVARRITQMLDCLDLSSLGEFALVDEPSHAEDAALHQWKPLVVDHFVKWMTASTSVTRPERLSSFRLECLGYDPNVWDAFVARFSSIQQVRVSIGEGAAMYPNSAVYATALALSMRRLPHLRELCIVVHVAGASSLLLSCLCQGLGSLAQVERFDVFVRMRETEMCDSCAMDSELALQEIGNALAFASSLKHVTISFNDAAKKRIPDVGVLFDQLRSSGSITKVCLTRVDVKGPKHTRFHRALLARASNQLERSDVGPLPVRFNPSIPNQSIKSLVLENCSIGKSYSSAFTFFEGIEDVTLTVEDWRPSDDAQQLSWSSQRAWTNLFRTHPHLKSFAVGLVDFSVASIDEESILAALVASLHRAPSLRDLTVCTNTSPRAGRTVSLPSLDRLFRTCNGKLTLQHEGVNDSSAESICEGLQATTSLTDVRLTVAGEAMTIQTVPSILSALQENHTVETFHGTFLFDSPVDVGFLDSVLEDLFLSNSVLESFGLDLLLRQRFDDETYIYGETPPNYTDLVVAPIARALARNRSLKVICLTGLEAVDPRSFALLFGMLKTNLTLERITFHGDVEDSEAKDEIEWLLALNRYKRRCLVQESNPVQAPADDFPARRLDDPNLHPLGEVLVPEDVRDPLPAAADPESLPGGVWPSVLERIATDRREDVMYHFLRRMPKSLLVVSVSDHRGL
jgi:hypothetical protein